MIDSVGDAKAPEAEIGQAQPLPHPMAELAQAELDRFAVLVVHRRRALESQALMPASLVPPFTSLDLTRACNGLDTALWAAGHMPRLNIGSATGTQGLAAVTVSFNPPRLPGMTPTRQLHLTRRFLRRHNVRARVAFDPDPDAYPRLAMTLDSVDDVRRLATVIAQQLTGLDAVRYQLRLAARSAGIDWYFTGRPHAAQPSELSIEQTHSLYIILTPEPVLAEPHPEDDEAIEELLDEVTRALGEIGVHISADRNPSDPHFIEFSDISASEATRLTSALNRGAKASTTGEFRAQPSLPCPVTGMVAGCPGPAVSPRSGS
uniref:hypothetical protein n=1 Tax=Streptomyces sp. CA-136453 TaxID=3240050 RepID=UPI003F492873